EPLIPGPVRLTGGRSVPGSASVEDEFDVEREQRLSPLELSKGNRSLQRGLLELPIALIRADEQDFPARLQLAANFLGGNTLRRRHLTPPSAPSPPENQTVQSSAARFITAPAAHTAPACRCTTSPAAATSAPADPSAAPQPSGGPHTTSRYKS